MKTLIKMQFDPEIAKKVGVGEAIMYANIEYWCGRNKLNNKNFHDGHYWTYNSKNAFTELFPFWTERQIRTILDNLRKKGYIKTGNYNKVKYDKTLWYAIVVPKEADGWTDQSNRADDSVQPIPNDKPDNKPSISTPAETFKKFLNSSNQDRVTLLEEKIKRNLTADEKNEIENFASYWMELNGNGTKQRWEFEKTFDLVRRIKTWFSNIYKYNKKSYGNKQQSSKYSGIAKKAA